MKKLILIFLFTSSLVAQVDRVEPPFWWSNMNHSDVQIMFHGKNIAQDEVSVSNGVVIKDIQKTANPNYLFITIDTKNVAPTQLTFTFKNKNKVVATQKYELKKRRDNSAQRQGYNSSDLIYLIMSDRFANANPNNDSSSETIEKADRTNLNGRHGGDIEGIIKNLDYIQSLGVTAVWPTPLCEDNDEKGSYHTYGQSDVYKIDSRFGTNEDYVHLSAELHKRGMKNIMDYVTNHWGYKHWMMNDLPTYDWIHQFPGYGQTNYHMSTQFDTHAAPIDAKMCMDGWFVKSMPDLNQSNPLVLNYLIQNALWWIEYADLDGFRVDTYSYCDKEGISKWTKSIMDEYPNFNIVGEVWMHSQAQMAYWQKDSKIGAIESYNSYLPSVMDFTLQDAVSSVFNENKATWDKGMIKIYDNFSNDFLYPNTNNMLVFLENHDTNRFNGIYKKDFNKYQMALALIATIRGIPQIYYGSEIGMDGDKGIGDGDIRKDFPGGWNGDANNAFTSTGRNAEQKKFYEYTSKLFNWRKNKSVIHTGKMTHYIPENNVYVYFRYSEKESVMVLVNNSTEKQTISTTRFHDNLQNYSLGTDVITGKQTEVTKEITIDGQSAMILELK
jgi:glycosidase